MGRASGSEGKGVGLLMHGLGSCCPIGSVAWWYLGAVLSQAHKSARGLLRKGEELTLESPVGGCMGGALHTGSETLETLLSEGISHSFYS